MKVELIAEVASNHGGDMILAKEFIHAFAEAGADWVKFQTTRVKHLRLNDPQHEWFSRAELSDEAHRELKAECEKAGTKFLTTVYHVDEVPFLASLGLEAIKIGSGEAGEVKLVTMAKAAFTRVLISDGLQRSHGIAHKLLRCVTRYPAPHGCVPAKFSNLYGYAGWSDHCCGLESCYLAILRGAIIIEKHVQLPNQARPPKPYEATVEEFKQLRAFADEDPAAKYIGRWQRE